MLRELFEQNPNIVINTDIDGILSGLLLVKYCNCNIVGFTNSKETVWLADAHNELYANIYVDMFVTDPRATCIDQHVVALNDQHMSRIRESGRIFSPQSDDENNLRIFTKDGFANKYPFGTFQYILARLENEGIDVQLPNLIDNLPNSNITYGDLFNRPDDAMQTTIYAYRENALYWWNWLLRLAPAGNILNLKTYLDNLYAESKAVVDAKPLQGRKRNHTANEYETQMKDDVAKIKARTKEYFKDNFGCRSGDGGFNKVVDENGNILPNVSTYINTIASLLGIQNLVIPTHYIAHKGKYCRTTWLDMFPDFSADYIFMNHQIFSYAFIFCPDEYGVLGNQNFSFTIDMQ